MYMYMYVEYLPSVVNQLLSEIFYLYVHTYSYVIMYVCNTFTPTSSFQSFYISHQCRYATTRAKQYYRLHDIS